MGDTARQYITATECGGREVKLQMSPDGTSRRLRAEVHKASASRTTAAIRAAIAQGSVSSSLETAFQCEE